MRASDSTRRNPLALFILGALLLAGGAAAAVFEHLNPVGIRHYVVWRSAPEARRIAAAQNRPILYAFLDARLEREIFGDADLASKLNRTFVLVRSDPRFAMQFGVGRAGLVVTDAEGGRHKSIGGHRGRAATEEFLFAAARELRERAPRNESQPLVEALSRIGRAFSPSFSPDARQIAFVSDLSGRAQLWIVDAGGGYPQLVASMPHGVDAAQWSPDGRWIAFASERQIWVVRPDGTGLRRLTSPGSARNLMNDWTGDGLLPVSSAFKASPSMESALFDPDTGRSRVLATTEGFGMITDVSCDGQSAIVLEKRGTITINDCSTKTQLAIKSNAFTRIRNKGHQALWRRDDAELSNAAVSADRTRAALIWNRAGEQQLGLLDLRTGAKTNVDLPLAVIRDVRFSRDATQLVLTGSDAQKPADVWVLDIATKAVRQVTRSSHPGVDLSKLVRPELIEFKSGDGLPLTGWFYRAAGTKAVISLHGGPMMQEAPAMNATYQALVASGVSVFAPNVRGSIGFGKRFMSLDDGALRVNAIADVKAAAGWLARNGFTRIGVMGESYGGWLALETATRHPSLFAAVADSYGMTDLERMIGEASAEVAPMLREEYGDDLDELSVDARDLNVPTLVLHGSRDHIVRIEHSNRLVRELRKRDVPVEYVVFEDDGHGFAEEKNRIRAATAIVEWFAKYL